MSTCAGRCGIGVVIPAMHLLTNMIMNNVFKFKDFEIGVRFDLKGSSVDRTYLSEGRNLKDHASTKIKTALKCGDFRNHVGSITFENY